MTKPLTKDERVDMLRLMEEDPGSALHRALITLDHMEAQRAAMLERAECAELTGLRALKAEAERDDAAVLLRGILMLGMPSMDRRITAFLVSMESE